MPARSKKQTQKNDSRMPLIPQKAINKADVLLGRGKATFKNPGNVAYRALIDTRLKVYFEGDRVQKGCIVMELINLIQDLGSRFLKKKGTSWEQVNIRTAREKVGHSIRDTFKASVTFKYQDDMRQLFDETSDFREILAYVIDNYKTIRQQISRGESATSNKSRELEDSEEEEEEDHDPVVVPDNDESSISSASVLESDNEMMEIEDVPRAATLLRRESKSIRFDRRRSSCRRASLVQAFISKLDSEIERLAQQESLESLRDNNDSLRLLSIAKIDEWIDMDRVETDSQHSDDEWSEHLVSLAARVL